MKGPHLFFTRDQLDEWKCLSFWPSDWKVGLMQGMDVEDVGMHVTSTSKHAIEMGT